MALCRTVYLTFEKKIISEIEDKNNHGSFALHYIDLKTQKFKYRIKINFARVENQM